LLSRRDGKKDQVKSSGIVGAIGPSTWLRWTCAAWFYGLEGPE